LITSPVDGSSSKIRGNNSFCNMAFILLLFDVCMFLSPFLSIDRGLFTLVEIESTSE
jgi:hypothetical protein